MSIQDVDNYASTKLFVLERYKIQEMCDKDVDDNPGALEFVSD